jgi:sialic acid synthase SpsE
MASNKPVLIAEIGGNHGGDPDLAAKMIRAAARHGFDGVKFQAYRTESILHQSSPYFDELKREETRFEDLIELAQLTKKLSLIFGLTVFDAEGLQLASSGAIDFIKISSGDLTYHPLIKMAAESGKPLVISTGAGTQPEVDRAFKLTNSRAIILQCSSLYPAPESAINLAVMDAWLQNGCQAGLSDHSPGTEAMKWAYLLGARMIEKHFTIDRNLPGGDNDISLDPAGMTELVNYLSDREIQSDNYNPIERAEILEALVKTPFWGSPIKTPAAGETPKLIRRHALAAKDLKKGEKLDLTKIHFKRLSPMTLDNQEILTPDQDLSNLSLNQSIAANDPIILSSLSIQAFDE